MLFVFYLYEPYALNSSEAVIEFPGHNAERLRISALCRGFRWLLLTCQLSVHASGHKSSISHSLVVSLHPVSICSFRICLITTELCVSHHSDFPLWNWYCCFTHAKSKSRISPYLDRLALIPCNVQSRDFMASKRATKMHLFKLLGWFFYCGCLLAGSADGPLLPSC